MKKKIPDFRNEDEEFEFWSKADTTEYLDWSKAKRIEMPKVKPALHTASKSRLRTAKRGRTSAT